jgi:hypothetical protein
MFHVVSYNADNFSPLQATTQKSALNSVNVCFSALLPTVPIIFPRCGPARKNYQHCCLHSGKMISVGAGDTTVFDFAVSTEML